MTAIFPTLSGLGFDVVRTPMWSTNIQTAVSGKETGVGSYSYPRYQWSLTYNFLRSDPAYAEFQTLVGFLNAQQGMLTPFLYQDADDNTATAQLIGTGDGTTTAFQLARGFGGFIEPVFAPNTVSNVYLNGASQSTGWSVSSYGSATPGVVTFASPPAEGTAITVDFTFYFPCRFLSDTQDFNMFLSKIYKTSDLKFVSLK